MSRRPKTRSPPDPDRLTLRNLELQNEGLELDNLEKRKPWHRKPSLLLPWIVSVVLAIAGVAGLFIQHTALEAKSALAKAEWLFADANLVTARRELGDVLVQKELAVAEKERVCAAIANAAHELRVVQGDLSNSKALVTDAEARLAKRKAEFDDVERSLALIDSRIEPRIQGVRDAEAAVKEVRLQSGISVLSQANRQLQALLELIGEKSVTQL